ncbi:MAG: hypothetical protein ACJ78Q_08210 [Chloroflexia bacterium]
MLGEIDLVDTLSASAFRATNGDCAWRRDDLPAVMESLAAGHYAILSGEVWVVEGNLFCPLSPCRTGGWTLLAWETPRREDHESWDHFAQRAADETLRAIHALNPEERVPLDIAGKLYYHLCFTDEPSYWPSTVTAA